MAFPLVADVKRHSLEDGPGIRSVVFFKGCPLRCVFCQNPETQSSEAEIAFRAQACIRCGTCARACPNGAVDIDLPGRIRRERCTRCGACAAACPGGAIRMIGTRYSPDELAAILLRDLPYYRHSGGGVTLSGGEATRCPAYVESLLRRLKPEGIHVALQTCGFFDYDRFARQILPHLDIVFFDIKILDPVAHRAHTGRGNAGITANFRRLAREASIPVHARIPLIPGITDGEDNLASIVRFLHRAGARDVSLLPYNPLGIDAAEALGRPRPSLPAGFTAPAREREIVDRFNLILQEVASDGRQAFRPDNRAVHDADLSRKRPAGRSPGRRDPVGPGRKVLDPGHGQGLHGRVERGLRQ